MKITREYKLNKLTNKQKIIPAALTPPRKGLQRLSLIYHYIIIQYIII